MGHPKKVTDARLKAVLKQHDGLQALTARTLGVSRQNVQQRIQRSPELQQFLADISAKMDDTCEDGIFKKLKRVMARPCAGMRRKECAIVVMGGWKKRQHSPT
jgi:hypothetical protein